MMLYDHESAYALCYLEYRAGLTNAPNVLSPGVPIAAARRLQIDRYVDHLIDLTARVESARERIAASGGSES